MNLHIFGKNFQKYQKLKQLLLVARKPPIIMMKHLTMIFTFIAHQFLTKPHD
ncbi:hypothetical protein SMU50_05598 [Streptococcus mutans 5SM3]|nr:hypothetical protein SMU50_05598 [Streptococcus mutans 5SM3]